MADDKTTKMPEQPVTDTGPGKGTPPEPEKTPTPPEAEKKTEQQAKSPQVSVYDFAEIMKGRATPPQAVPEAPLTDFSRLCFFPDKRRGYKFSRAFPLPGGRGGGVGRNLAFRKSERNGG